MRRKFRTNGNKIRWWFIVHGPEQILAMLDEQWPVVHMQTAWRLEPCFAPNEALSDGPSISPSEPSDVPATNISQTASVSSSPAVALDTSVNETETVSNHHSPESQLFLDPN